MQKLIVASSNKGKLREIKTLLGDRYEIVSMKEAGIDIEIDETGVTFEENALIKAKTVYGVCGCPVISDDSGLMVDALGGAPGVYSARYAGEEHDDLKNNEKLMREMQGKTNRTARYVAAVAYYDGERCIMAIGSVEGEIMTEEKGTHGFGYDPMFYSTELNMGFGEASDELKNTVSHRARAFAALTEQL